MNDTHLKLEETLGNSLSLVLTENEEIINNLDDIKTITGWYKEAKEDPNRIPSMIINKIIEELLNHTKRYFIDTVTKNLKIQCQINRQRQEVKGNLRINFKSVNPYVEFMKLIDGKEVPPALRFTFKIDIDGNFKGLKIHSSPIISIGPGVRRKEINLDKFSFDLTISIIRLPTLNLFMPIYLYHKEQFKVENLHFYL